MTLKRYRSLGLIGIALSIILGAAIDSGQWNGVDTAIFKLIALTANPNSESAIAIARLVTRVGDPGWRAGIVVVVLVGLAWRRRMDAVVTYLVTIGTTIAGYSIAKAVFARDRPDLVPLLDLVDTYAYPSGHAAGAMVVLVLGAMLLGGRIAILAAVLVAGAIGVSRIALGVHWPSDVVGGWLFGGGAALIGYAALPASRGPARATRRKERAF